MKKRNIYVWGAIMVLLFASCKKVMGDGPVVTETRNREAFTGVDLRVSGNVYVQQDTVQKLELKAQQSLLQYLETYVSEGRLVIKFRNGVRVRSYEDIAVTIHVPTVNSLSISGSGNIWAKGSFSSSDMDMVVSGSGNIHVQELKTGYLQAAISGSGDIKVQSGSANEEKLRISGSGNMDLAGLAAKNVNSATSGSGDIKVHATGRLDVSISGSGSVYYTGIPVVSTSISGSGKVIPL